LKEIPGVKRKILICGANGQLGNDCSKGINKTYDVMAVDIDGLDITDPDSVEKTIKTFGPDIVINCAAFTRVDECETKKEHALKANTEGPDNLARCIDKYGGKLVHISTDYVFDGKKEPPDFYVEDDKTNPLSWYGSTKLDGELAIRRITDKHIIVRTAWVFGIKGGNFLKTILKLAMKNAGRELRIINDQYGSPTWTYRLAEQILKLIEANGQGTYHASSEGYCTWFELAEYFLGKMEVGHNLVPCSTDEYPTPAVRPHNSILENRRLKEDGINIMPYWKDDIDLFVEKFKTALLEEIQTELQIST
jgi:dTDP-4-dehydrorhamnose reductase